MCRHSHLVFMFDFKCISGQARQQIHSQQDTRRWLGTQRDKETELNFLSVSLSQAYCVHMSVCYEEKDGVYCISTLIMPCIPHNYLSSTIRQMSNRWTSMWVCVLGMTATHGRPFNTIFFFWKSDILEICHSQTNRTDNRIPWEE